MKSAERAIALVELIAERGSVSFGEILSTMSLPRSSAHVLLRTLTGSGWISHNAETKRYSLGLRAWQVGRLYPGTMTLVGLASAVMDRLRDELGETVQLAQLDGVYNVYVAISETDKPMRLVSSVGARLEAHATGVGKALLSMIPREEAERRLRASAPLPRLTSRTIVDIDALLAAIDNVGVLGYAVDDEEYVDGCRCVAVPVAFDPSGDVPTAITATMPTSRTDSRWPSAVANRLAWAAEDIRQRLYAHGPG